MNREIIQQAIELDKQLYFMDEVIAELRNDVYYNSNNIAKFTDTVIYQYHAIHYGNIPKDEEPLLRAIQKNLLKLAYNKRAKLSLALSKLE